MSRTAIQPRQGSARPRPTGERSADAAAGAGAVSPRVRFAVAGMGGYAGHVANRFLADMVNPEGRVELVAVCDPAPGTHGDRVARLAAHGVGVYDAFDEMLDRKDVDAVWLPLPIDLHRRFTERALAAGKHVVVEKPAAGTVQDIDAMIAARDASGLLCAVGFQDLYRPDVRRLKRRLLSGDLGRPLRASVVGCWYRDARYFARNAWAGRFRSGDAWVLDSVANNAMAHFVNLALFVLGDREDASALLTRVEAELYRVNNIENFDTCTVRATTAGGIKCAIALTHACERMVEPVVMIVTDRARISLHHPGTIVCEWNGSVARETVREGGHPWAASDGVARRIQGDLGAPIATLESARAHTQLINVIAETAPVHRVPAAEVRPGPDSLFIPGIEGALLRCAADGQLLHELGAFAWARPGGATDVTRGYAFGGRLPRADE